MLRWSVLCTTLICNPAPSRVEVATALFRIDAGRIRPSNVACRDHLPHAPPGPRATVDGHRKVAGDALMLSGDSGAIPGCARPRLANVQVRGLVILARRCVDPSASRSSAARATSQPSSRLIQGKHRPCGRRSLNWCVACGARRQRAESHERHQAPPDRHAACRARPDRRLPPGRSAERIVDRQSLVQAKRRKT